MIGRMIICCLLFSLNVAGQEQEAIDSVGIQEKAAQSDIPTTLMGRLHQVQQILDDKARKKVDPHYIEVPDKPWRVILRYKMNAVDVDFENSFYPEGLNQHSEWKLCFEPPTASSVGFWVGYRGTGISFSKSLTENAGRYFSVSSTGANYGFNFRLRRFNTADAEFSVAKYTEEKSSNTSIDTAFTMPSPVWIRSVYVNGYYVFNGRRYSQAAAYNQSVIQRRSAGSLLVGATWYQSSFDYSELDNLLFVIVGNGIHRIKVHQANLGVGYGYNFVPFRGLVVNAMAMPTLSVYNRVKVYRIDCNYNLSPIDEVNDYGQWNKDTKTWANGKSHKSILMVDESNDTFDYWDLESETNYSMLHLNVDLRLGIAYNWKNWFLGFQAQLNNFSYKNDDCRVNLSDAYGQVSLGVRL